MIQKMKLSSSNLKKYFTFQDGIVQHFSKISYIFSKKHFPYNSGDGTF